MSTGLPPGEPTFGRERTAEGSAAAAIGGHLWSYQAGDRSMVAYDRTGASRSEPVPGMLVVVDEDWLVTRDLDAQRLRIHRLTR